MPDFLLRQLPLAAAQPAEAWCPTLPANVLGDAVCLVYRYVEQIVIFVFNTQVFALNIIQNGFDQPYEFANAVVDVHNPVAWLKVAIKSFW